MIQYIRSLFATPITVEQVHREFLTASEKLLAEANAVINHKANRKAERLSKIGFEQSVEVKKSQESRELEQAVKVIQKYRMTHPNNKVITGDQVKKICEKYNLVMGAIERYTGFVPEKNLAEIESFKKPKHKEDSSEYSHLYNEMLRNMAIRWGWPSSSFNICAPVKDMMINESDRVIGHKIVPDPVVLFAVENDCYLIVTAWGDEASDPLVVNEKMN